MNPFRSEGFDTVIWIVLAVCVSLLFLVAYKWYLSL